MVIAVDFVWVGFAASLRVTVKEKLPATLGVPEMIPVEDARDSPVGRVPEVVFQV
jgi:hypothetical protein